MTLFKASLWSSVLTVCGLALVSAAPQSLLAGRVPSDGGLELLRNIPSLSPFLTHGGLPAFSLVRTLPAVNSFPAVQQTQRLSQPALSPLPPVPSVVTNLAPLEKAVLEEEEENLPARYNFGYSVADLESGDSKSRQESREGDLVTGSYSVADPDGRIRTVTYTADSEHGFQAVVTYDGEAGPVAIPFNKPTQTVQAAEPVVIAKDIDQLLPLPQPQPQILPLPELQPLPQPQSAENDDDELEIPEVKTVEEETNSVPSLFDQFSQVPAVFPSVPRVFGSPQTLSSGAVNNLHGHSFPQFFAANSPRFVTTVPGLFNQLQLQALLHNNNLHQVQTLPRTFPHAGHHALHQTLPHGVHHGVHHGLPQGVALRAGAAPLDLSQFTFLSNGQVVG